MKISIIIPVINEPNLLQEQLQALQIWRRSEHELIVVDGGSEETLAAPQQQLADCFLEARRGRAQQMNEGARVAAGDVLLFLHVDTRLPDNACVLIGNALRDSSAAWGRFDLRLSGESWIFRIIERAINFRSHHTGIVTGDQGLFVRRSVFAQIGGYAPIPLMEDVEISKRLRRISRPLRIREPVVTSSRRWEQRGVVSTVLLMWWLRLRYFLGTSPEILVKKYYK